MYGPGESLIGFLKGLIKLIISINFNNVAPTTTGVI